jgi:hypothetical protein
MPPATYLGLDAASSNARPSGYAVVDKQAQLLAVGLVGTDDEMLALASRWRLRLVAIDAPLSWPLEPESKGRQCEVRLAREGIGTFRTTRLHLRRGGAPFATDQWSPRRPQRWGGPGGFLWPERQGWCQEAPRPTM